MDTWPLPPELPWPRFLRLLRHPAPPRGWLERAAEVPELRKRPLLLRWVAQHLKAPAHLRVTLLGRLPWRALALVANDAGAHPQARQLARERLQHLWPVLSTGERTTLALLAPSSLWPLVWKTPSVQPLLALFQNPRFTLDALLGLLQPALRNAQLEALEASKWAAFPPVQAQVLLALDRTLEIPESGLVLGAAAPWIKRLAEEDRILVAAQLRHPALRRMVRGRAVEEVG